jgi:hypothetical protein
MLIRKAARHDHPRRSASTTSAPSAGPQIAASPITGPMLPSAFASSLPSNIALTSPNVWGMTSAAAAPCTARQAINTETSGASAQPTEATPNPATPIRKTRLRPAMSPSRPPVISSSANGSVYAAPSHCTSAVEPPSTAWIVGAATCTIVASSRFIASATSNAASASQRHL